MNVEVYVDKKTAGSLNSGSDQVRSFENVFSSSLNAFAPGKPLPPSLTFERKPVAYPSGYLLSAPRQGRLLVSKRKAR